MLATAEMIKERGFNEEVVGISDVIPAGETKSPLTLYIEKAIRRSETRLRRWVGDERYDIVSAFPDEDIVKDAYVQAEVLLSIANILPAVYLQNFYGEEQIEIDGLRLRAKNLTTEEQTFQRQMLVNQAENYLFGEIPETVDEGFAVL